jgi:hypothetical protein
MPKLKSFRELIAWQKAMNLVDLVYELTERFPRREHFGLAHQLRKSAVSIPSNIAEGTRHRTPGYVHQYTFFSASWHSPKRSLMPSNSFFTAVR